MLKTNIKVILFLLLIILIVLEVFMLWKIENGITQTYDLIFKGVEITSGAQREHRPEILKNKFKKKELILKL